MQTKDLAKVGGITTDNMPYVRDNAVRSGGVKSIVNGETFYLDVLEIAEKLGLKNPTNIVKKKCPKAFEMRAADKDGNIQSYTVNTVEGAAPLFKTRGIDKSQRLLKSIILDTTIEGTLGHIRKKRDYFAPKQKSIWSFENHDFGRLPVLIIDEESWFPGKMVAETLGYERGTKAVVDHVDEEDRLMIDRKTQSHFGIEMGQRGGWLINEPGLYSLIFNSALPTAKAFKRWVTKEVLPSIRKTGSYSIWGTPINDEAYTKYALMSTSNNAPRYKIKQLMDIYIQAAGITPKEAYNNLISLLDKKYQAYRYQEKSLQDIREELKEDKGSYVTWPEVLGSPRGLKVEQTLAAIDELFKAVVNKEAAPSINQPKTYLLK